jgi:hypothetical protein
MRWDREAVFSFQLLAVPVEGRNDRTTEGGNCSSFRPAFAFAFAFALALALALAFAYA